MESPSGVANLSPPFGGFPVTLDRRLAGVLLHPTSLPGAYGIGDLGPECIKFLDWMKEAGIGIWQVLPLGPTGFADSPYQCFSAFAGNTFLISPDLLKKEGLLTAADLKGVSFPEDKVDYGPVIEWKNALLRKTYDRYQAGRAKGKFDDVAKRLDAWRKKKMTKVWLEDYALFIALKDAHNGRVWNTWAKGLRVCDEAAVAKARKEHAEQIEYQVFLQFLFFDQWETVRAAARERNIAIVGDMPIYVAFDSADTWANQNLFQIDKKGNPKAVAGVPPDYFSETGQLWGNPLYDWDLMDKNGYKWWITRMKGILELVDVIRLDHFRGFEAYWSVPFGEETAINGKWIPGPGNKLFKALQKGVGKDLPIIAENLGVITAEVEALRHEFNLPGMKVLQFGWTAASTKPPVPDPGCDFQPHKVEVTSTVYTGTHDNNTTAGWWKDDATPSDKALFKAYFDTDGKQAHETLIRAALASVGNTTIIPMQDFLGLGGEARMNFPGREAGNWQWRLKKGHASKALAKKILNQVLLFERHPEQKALAEGFIKDQSTEERARKP